MGINVTDRIKLGTLIKRCQRCRNYSGKRYEKIVMYCRCGKISIIGDSGEIFSERNFHVLIGHEIAK